MVVFHSKLFAEDSIEGWKPLEKRMDANIISTIHFKSRRAVKIVLLKYLKHMKMSKCAELTKSDVCCLMIVR